LLHRLRRGNTTGEERDNQDQKKLLQAKLLRVNLGLF
jgi:hypothetical protein